MESASIASLEDSTYKTEWWYAWPLADNPDNKGMWLLKVSEESSQEDIESEIEYWMNEARVYGTKDLHGKAIMAAIKWMSMLLTA